MNWKRFVCPFLSFLLVCGCSTAPKLEDYPNTHQEIGTSLHEKAEEETFVYNITYPNTSLQDIDERIQEELMYAKKSFQENLKTYTSERKAELNIDYQSYVVENRYISIKLDIFESLYENKERIVSMVYDTQEERFIEFADVFDEGALEILSSTTQKHYRQVFPDECENTNFQVFSAPANINFQTFVLRKDKVVFYFQEHTLFDQSEYLEVSYDVLEDVTHIESEAMTTFVPYNDILNEPVKVIDQDKAMVALTFDDGPTPTYTTAILDALKETNASATFFVLGNRAKNFPEILQRMILEGNEVGNHTYSHKQLTALSKLNIEEEINHTQEVIHDVINRYPVIIRPPYGSKNDTVVHCAQGKKIVTWSLDTQDWKLKDAKKIVDKVMREVQDGSIILMHDLYATSAQAAVLLIEQLPTMGYQLVTVSQLLEAGKAPFGKVL